MSEKPWLFKPGQSGNPSGRPADAMKAEMRASRQYAKFKDILLNLQDLTTAEIETWTKDPARTMLETTAGKLILESSKGNLNALALVSERLFGKVKDTTDLTVKKDWSEELDTVERTKIVDLLRKKA